VQEQAAYSVKRINELEAEFQHDMIAFVTNVGEHLGKNACYFHQGLTSYDIIDTALSLQLQDASRLIEEGLRKLQLLLAGKAQQYKYTPIAGRTHGMHAEPTTFGLKLAGFYAELNRDIERFKIAVKGIEVGKISGAVGTYPYLSPHTEARVMTILGLKPDSISSQIVQRDRHAFYLATLAVIGGTLERLALEIRHLARTEIGEVEEPFGKHQRGSSAMPHKKNPVVCERICGLARILRSNALAALENQALWHERDISHSSVERIILPDSTVLLDYMLERSRYVVKEMTVNAEKMTQNLELSQGLIYSQAVLNALLDKGIERDKAYSMVQKWSKKSREQKLSFLDLLKTEEESIILLSPEEIAACFEASPKHIDEVYERLGL
jgi:adenylosuccinate lyase